MSIAVAAPGTRPAVSPRPARSGVRGPVARPDLAPRPGRSRSAAACRVQRPARGQFLLAVKVGAVSLLAVLGVGVSVAEFASWQTPDPAVEYVAGDPAWSHVDGQ